MHVPFSVELTIYILASLAMIALISDKTGLLDRFIDWLARVLRWDDGNDKDSGPDEREGK